MKSAWWWWWWGVKKIKLYRTVRFLSGLFSSGTWPRTGGPSWRTPQGSSLDPGCRSSNGWGQKSDTQKWCRGKKYEKKKRQEEKGSRGEEESTSKERKKKTKNLVFDVFLKVWSPIWNLQELEKESPRRGEKKQALTFTSRFYTPTSISSPLPPCFYLTLHISKNMKKSEGVRSKGAGERRRRKEPVKLNSFPPSPKRSHGGHGSTLPSGSLKLLISFSYSNDFYPLRPFFILLPVLPLSQTFSWKFRSRIGAVWVLSLVKTCVFALNFAFKAPVGNFLLVHIFRTCFFLSQLSFLS